jgi:fused signal recognition particle receptor
MFRKLMDRFDRLMGRGVIDEQFYEELEDALLQADTHVQITQEILAELREAIKIEKITEAPDIKARLQLAIANRFRQGDAAGLAVNDNYPTVYMFVGVNGVGKTTSIAKLAYLLKTKFNQSVMLAAGDTFRAAAIEQLEVWGKRIGTDIVKSQPGADSATVLFDAITAAKARGAQFVLCDTAGRQHSKANLMAELDKVRRVTNKALGRDPDEVLLVIDANTGQNAIRQAEEFTKTAGVTGLILTKLDGTARGGALIGIYDRLKVPIKFIGVGEKVEDLRDFDPETFAAQLFS